MGKVGRNDPCPCGSGKKYKKCCEEKDKTPSFQKKEFKVLSNKGVGALFQGALGSKKEESSAKKEEKKD
ncbi:MAG: SEC-C metal-binding domain-containing protein [Parachlamydiales bacterium]|jgi:hypothetical protein